jgi:hypothetical protein
MAGRTLAPEPLTPGTLVAFALWFVVCLGYPAWLWWEALR